jgi:Raf kinase inhibitor-like YbhB/YbcL family protein
MGPLIPAVRLCCDRVSTRAAPLKLVLFVLRGDPAVELVSNSLAEGAPFPAEFAFAVRGAKTHIAFGRDRNPQLLWRDVPASTKSFALIFHDPDVPNRLEDVNQEGRWISASFPRTTFFHWLLLDIPAAAREIPAGGQSDGIVPHGKPGPAAPGGLRHGLNDFTKFFANDSKMRGDYYCYDGPAPPWNDELPHRYVFTLYALDTPRLEIRGVLTGENVSAALAGHVLADAGLTRLYSLNPEVAEGPAART